MPANAADQVTARLRQIRALAAGPATQAAATAMAHLGVAGTQVTLTKYSHPPGDPTPSPPGEPPAVVTGTLRRSVRATPAIPAGPGRYIATIGGTVIYARIQELGGTIHAKGGGMLHWTDSSGHHAARSVTLPPRPYLKPTAEKLAASGKLSEVAAQAFIKTLGG